MATSIFSTYNTAENQVTSTILAVFEKLNSSTVTRILQVLMEDSTIELIIYQNQIKSPESVPDGRIKGIFDYVLETKVDRDVIKVEQIINHCKGLEHVFSKLLIITPDAVCPESLKNLHPDYKEKIIWGNFDKIIDGINVELHDLTLLLDREKFLLMELKEFIINKRLTSEDYSKKVLIVPAGFAWNFYKQYSLYRCQANRTFQPSSYIGFYAERQIKEFFPKILGYIENFNIQSDDLDKIEIITVNNTEKEDVKERLREIKKSLKADEWNENYKFMILTKISDPDTYKNEYPINNDKTSYSDKGTAFVSKANILRS